MNCLWILMPGIISHPDVPGPIVQSVVRQTTDPGVMSSILARSLTFTEIIMQ